MWAGVKRNASSNNVAGTKMCLDETDSRSDVDAKLVAEGVNALRSEAGVDSGYYALSTASGPYIKPDVVHTCPMVAFCQTERGLSWL
jgi:Fe-S cluster assembly ATPase SufC